MNFLYLKYKLFVVFFSLFILINESAIIDRFNEVAINEIESENKNYDKYNYNAKDNCEIKIVTRGVCTVNSQVIKPRIIIKHSSRDKYGPNSKNIRNDDRWRNMNQFNIGEEKANNLVDEFLMNFKDHYGAKIDPLILPEMGLLKFNKWGSAKIYELTLKGISNIKRHGSIMLHTNSKMKTWSINANLSINNLTTEFMVDAKLINRVYIKGWKLEVLIEKCLLNAVILFEETTKMLTISSLTVNYIEGFKLQTENLSWPFNEVVKQILERQKEQFKSIITNNAQKYMSETLKSIDVTQIVNKMLKK